MKGHFWSIGCCLWINSTSVSQRLNGQSSSRKLYNKNGKLWMQSYGQQTTCPPDQNNQLPYTCPGIIHDTIRGQKEQTFIVTLTTVTVECDSASHGNTHSFLYSLPTDWGVDPRSPRTCPRCRRSPEVSSPWACSQQHGGPSAQPESLPPPTQTVVPQRCSAWRSSWLSTLQWSLLHKHSRDWKTCTWEKAVMFRKSQKLTHKTSQKLTLPRKDFCSIGLRSRDSGIWEGTLSQFVQR